MAVAYQLATRLSPSLAHRVISAANGAFLDGLRVASLVAAGVAAVAALAVIVLLPARAATPEVAAVESAEECLDAA
jgi:hypothetical protein